MSRAWLVLLALGCRKPSPPEAAPTPSPGGRSVASPIVTTGEVVDGRFIDRERGFSVEVPEGWTARVGLEPSPQRVVLSRADGVRVEIWVFEEDSVRFRQRQGCTWTFEDTGPYQWLRVPDPVTVGTCRPERPDGPWVLATAMARGGYAYHVEAMVPPGLLIEGRLGAREVAGTLRFLHATP